MSHCKSSLSTLGLLITIAGMAVGCGGGGGGSPTPAQPPPPPPEPGPTTITVTPEIDRAEIREAEPEIPATLSVSLNEAADSDIGVRFGTSGDAILGVDYDLEDQELTIVAGETRASTTITPIRDFEEEGPEDAVFTIESATGDVTIAETAPSITIVDEPSPPNAKLSIAPDLIAIAGDAIIHNDRVELKALAYNWGGAQSSPTDLLIAVNDQPDWSVSNLWLGSVEVPILDPRSGIEFTFTIQLGDFSPSGDYYAIIQVDEIPEEHPGRSYTNQDFVGFSLDGAGRVVVQCQSGQGDRGAAPGTVDPLTDEQWHLVNTGQSAFAQSAGTPEEDLGMANTLTSGPSGQGVRILVADTGLETCHPELAPNAAAAGSHNFNTRHWAGSKAADPFLPSTLGDHGTSVAGLAAAAANNGIGGRGVAPSASILGYNTLAAIDWLTAWTDSLGGSSATPNSASADIFNMSFGSLGIEDNPHPDGDVQLFRHGVDNLRGGRGAIYVKAAGNGFRTCRSMPRPVNDEIGCLSANSDPINNLPYLIVVGGSNALGERASYASAGANLWITAPAGEDGQVDPAMITTDQMGTNRGYDAFIPVGLAGDAVRNPYGDFVSMFNGTSAATPNVSGAVALLLEKHPELDWRDVKHILAKTARRIDSSIAQVRYGIGGSAYVLQLPWTTNAAGYHFHNWFGFGALSVDEALDYAASHSPGSLGEYVETSLFSNAQSAPIPDHDGAGLRQTLDVSGLAEDAAIEAVILEIDASHPQTNDLGIHLVSPSGTESILNPVFNEALAGDLDLRWQLLSNAFYGETPNGQWTLKVVDAAPGDAGQLNSWALRFSLGSHP